MDAAEQKIEGARPADEEIECHPPIPSRAHSTFSFLDAGGSLIALILLVGLLLICYYLVVAAGNLGDRFEKRFEDADQIQYLAPR